MPGAVAKLSAGERVLGILVRLRNTLFPTRKDNLKQIAVKLVFLISLVVLIASAVWLIGYFSDTAHQEQIVGESREIWYDNEIAVSDRFSLMKEENPDFMAWLTVSGADVDMPVYQGEDDTYYLKHNQRKEYNIHGALYFSADDVIERNTSDKNFVIYGHDMKDGTMFSNLGKYRDIEVYRNNPNISLSTVYGDEIYKIYAVFLLNAVPEDDDGYLYDINKSSFRSETVFDEWVEEARERSIIDTGVDLEYGDSILTLVTCADDFENARLVVMARRVRDGENALEDTSKATVNPSPLYPKRWYDENGLKYPN